MSASQCSLNSNVGTQEGCSDLLAIIINLLRVLRFLSDKSSPKRQYCRNRYEVLFNLRQLLNSTLNDRVHFSTTSRSSSSYTSSRAISPTPSMDLLNSAASLMPEFCSHSSYKRNFVITYKRISYLVHSREVLKTMKR